VLMTQFLPSMAAAGSRTKKPSASSSYVAFALAWTCLVTPLLFAPPPPLPLPCSSSRFIQLGIDTQGKRPTCSTRTVSPRMSPLPRSAARVVVLPRVGRRRRSPGTGLRRPCPSASLAVDRVRTTRYCTARLRNIWRLVNEHDTRAGLTQSCWSCSRNCRKETSRPRSRG